MPPLVICCRNCGGCPGTPIDTHGNAGPPSSRSLTPAPSPAHASHFPLAFRTDRVASFKRRIERTFAATSAHVVDADHDDSLAPTTHTWPAVRIERFIFRIGHLNRRRCHA